LRILYVDRLLCPGFARENVVCASHVASGSGQVVARFNESLSDAVRRAFAGEPPKFSVTAWPVGLLIIK
jgi:phosphoglycerate dehydrogenase-like enzyme